MNIQDYYDEPTWQRLKQFADAQLETPFLVVDLKTIQRQYQELQQGFPKAKIYYAVKANPAAPVIQMLANEGSYFDIASTYELDKVMALGVPAERVSYGNTIKKQKDIRYFYQKGVRLFVTDSEIDLRHIAHEAPGSRVYVRILSEGSLTADWPLSRKFGCQADVAVDLLKLAAKLGLEPYGISFHVGSQQRDIGAWDAAISKVTFIFERLAEDENIKLKMINLGGGFPAHYVNKVHPLTLYAEEIHRFLADDFGDDVPEIFLEPGRSITADAGLLVSEVVLISRKSKTSLHRWIYTDIGKFNGLIETLEEAIKFPIYTEKSGSEEDVILAGPTCDSMDILYEDYKYKLPLNLAVGDRLYWFSTGAYTTSYSSVEFNGFPPLVTYII
jgi:ornithine decarboxylase